MGTDPTSGPLRSYRLCRCSRQCDSMPCNKLSAADAHYYQLIVRNLAIADLSILLISFPFAIVKEQDPYHWQLGEFHCRCVFPLSDLFFGVSLWSITLIAVDRHHGHRAIVRGVLPKRGSSVFKSSRLMVVCVWILSFLIISVPQYYTWSWISSITGQIST